ncbi:T9SS type A sorting domain-containing protein [Flavobacterium sp. ZT3R25]|uniref:T9SS type A sorting domain-containing protein n=1 Tax=Flavobacterium galactosi TaxID=3398735 RepID=UPI003A8785B1
MKKNSLLTFFEVLSGKISSCYLSKNIISALSFFISNFSYFSPKSQNKNLASGYSQNNVSQSGYKGMFLYLRNIVIFLSVSFFGFTTVTAQTFPGLSSCTSKDLELISVTLPAPVTDPCNCTGTRKLILGIRNKTGSTRTSFAFWGTLIRRNANGDPVDASGNVIAPEQPIGVKIFACASNIKKSSDNFLPATYGTTDIAIACNQSLEIVDLYLAWTSASPGETCDVLFNNPSTINPKCGTLPFIPIGVGVDATFAITSATCTAGGSITVSPSGGKAPYVISIDGSGFTSATTYSNLVAGSHSFIIKDANQCSTTKTRTVGSSSAPTVSAGSPFIKTCISNPNGIAIGETNDPTATYSWSPTSGLSSSTVSNPTANPTSTTTYTVTKTIMANGCSAQASVIVTVDKDAPTASAGGDVTINCTTPTTTLHATGGVSYSWSPAAGLSATDIANPTATPTSTTTYTVTVTGANGCTATDSVVVTVDKDVPTAGAGGDVTINCTTPTTTLHATGGVSYSWSPSAGLSATNIANPTATPTSTTTYTVTVTGINGCTATDSVVVTVDKDVPTAGAGGDVTINCTTPTTTLHATGGVSYSWSPAAGLSATNIADPTAKPTSTTTYTVTVTGANGCTATDSVLVTVDKAAPTAGAGGDVTINCNTPNTTLHATGGISYSWTPVAGLSATNIANPTATPTSTTTYTVTVTGANGCTATDDVVVTVDKAAPTAAAGGDVTINCITPSTTLNATLNATGGVSYSWSPVAGLSATNIANPTATPTATTTYTVTVTGVNGCTATDSVVVTVDKASQPAPTVCVVQPSLCGPTTGSVTILSPLGTDYEYSIDNGVNWKAGTLFSPLAPGSVTGIKVKKLSSGCISDAANCDNSNCAAPSPAKITNPDTKTTETIVPVETTLTAKTTNVGFDAYPVPFKDQLTIKYKFDYVSDVKIEVFNAQGISVLSKMDTNSYLNKEIALDLKLNRGKEQVYIVKVTTDRGSSVKKVMSSR